LRPLPPSRKTLFHDGRATSLEEQALFPMMSPFEMNRNLDYLEEVLKTVPAYVDAFRSVFGGEITRRRVAMAIAAFERTLLSRDTPLDRGKVSGFPEYRTLTEDPGRFLVTRAPEGWKAFATPPLREVASTAPYMHNGALATLDDVIDFYDRGGGDDPKKSPLLRPLGLSREEKESLREFLATGLSGGVTEIRPPVLP
jgi:cytochrome c peroxidase